MEFDEGQQIDLDQIDDRRGRGGGGGFGGMSSGGGGFPIPMGRVGGGGGLLLILAFFLLKSCAGGGGGGFAVDPGNVGVGNAQVQQAGSNDNLADECKVNTNWSKNRSCRAAAVVNSVQAFWSDTFRRSSDGQYQEAPTVFFSGGTNTGCGSATSAVGPFYCPRDQNVYIDLDFYDELQSRFGASGGDFAEAYVLAHEYGHHVQNMLGTSAQVERAGRQSGPDSPSVRLELQADCYAGVWAAHATSGPNRIIKGLSEDDIREGLDAAAAVGDDRIQAKMQGRVTPESWTHGSAKSRQKWFLTGFNSGEPANCDTFNTDNL